jgi:Galactose oxidase, central domain
MACFGVLGGFNSALQTFFNDFYEVTIKKEEKNVKLDVNACSKKQFSEFAVFTARAGFGHVVASFEAVYIYGGQTMERIIGEFFIYDARKHKMEKIEKERNPGPRNACSMAYSKELWSVFLYGGANELGPLNDLWVFEEKTNEWREIKIKGMQSGREMAAMSIDEKTKRIFVAGGRNAAQIFDSIICIDLQEGSCNECSFKLPKPLCAFGFAPFQNGQSLLLYGGTDGMSFVGELIICELISGKTRTLKVDAEVTNETGDIFGGGVIAPSVAFNEFSGKLLLFGGSSPGQESSSLYVLGKEKLLI